MTGITPGGFEIDRDFAAPPSAVFAAWTTAEHFARWFGGKDVQVPADRLDYEPAAGRAWSAAPDFTDEQRKATIAGWQTFFDVLQQIAEAA
jgi:hypothetical protein